MISSVAVECIKCHTSVTANTPVQEMVNRPNTSILIVEHPERFLCVGCGTELTLAVAGAQIMLVGMPAPAKPNGLVLVG